MHGVGTRERTLSRLNGWPMRSPVNASPRPSRATAHDSGPMWIATPSSQGTCTLYSLPVSRRFAYFFRFTPIADVRESWRHFAFVAKGGSATHQGHSRPLPFAVTSQKCHGAPSSLAL